MFKLQIDGADVSYFNTNGKLQLATFSTKADAETAIRLLLSLDTTFSHEWKMETVEE